MLTISPFVTLVYVSLLAAGLATKIFFVGGGANENSTLVFNALANVVVGRPAQPNRCNEDWKTTSCPRIAIVTSGSANQAAGNTDYGDDSEIISYRTMLRTYGMTSKHISVHIDNYKVDSNISTAKGLANLQIISQADVIYFNGGDQARHSRAWLNDDGSANPLLEVAKRRIILNQLIGAGSSAGSMIWANQTFGDGNAFGVAYFHNSVGLAPKKVTDGAVNGSGLSDTRNGTKSLQYDYNAGRMPAFGILPFVTDTHFNARGRLGRLVPVMLSFKQQYAIGVDENTSLYYDNGIGTVFGWNGVTICDIKNAVIDEKPYFSIKNVTLSFLTAGDKFNFATKSVISNKSLITSPAYSNPTDSNDILAAYEATLLQTRLVDQRALYNLGRTKTPSGFPKTTPTFQLKFSRNAETKGYYSNKKYTVQHAILDFAYGSNSKNLLQE